MISILESLSIVFKTSLAPTGFLISWINVRLPFNILTSLLPKATLKVWRFCWILLIPSSSAIEIAPIAFYALKRPTRLILYSIPLIFISEWFLYKVTVASYFTSGLLYPHSQ